MVNILPMIVRNDHEVKEDTLQFKLTPLRVNKLHLVSDLVVSVCLFWMPCVCMLALADCDYHLIYLVLHYDQLLLNARLRKIVIIVIIYRWY